MPGYNLTKSASQKKDGTRYAFYSLRQAYYDKNIAASKNRYIAYIGVEPILSESKAKEISEKKGVPLDELHNVTNLSIIPDDEYEKFRRDRRAAQKEARALAKEKATGGVRGTSEK